LSASVFPVIGALGLRTVAKAAMQHHHQGHRTGEPLRPVEIERSARAGPLDGLSGLSDRDRRCIGRSQRVTAAKTPAEQDDQGREKADAEKPERIQNA